MLSLNHRPHAVLSLAAVATLSLGATAHAAVVYETADPFGGPFGLFGFDVFAKQTVGVRFIPDSAHRLDSLGLWFMNNDDSGGHPLVTATLRNDVVVDGMSLPGDHIIETWQFNVSAVGWDPQLEVLESKLRPLLRAGVRYWIVCESDSPPFIDGVWNAAGTGTGFTAICNGDPCEWFSGEGGVVATVVQGTPTLAADLNEDGLVNGLDLAILLGQWGPCPAVGPCDADLDHNGIVNGLDLAILLGAWAP